MTPSTPVTQKLRSMAQQAPVDTQRRKHRRWLLTAVEIVVGLGLVLAGAWWLR